MNGRRAKIIKDFSKRHFGAAEERRFGLGEDGLRRFYRFMKRQWVRRNHS